MRFKKSIVFFLGVVCEELTSTYVLKIISYEICSSLLLTVFMSSLRQSSMCFKAVARCPAFATKCQACGATSILLFVFQKQEKTKKRKEERRKFFLPLYSSTSLFLFLFYSSCDLVFFSYWDFFPLDHPFASPHVFVRARCFILTLFLFLSIHAP